MVTHWSPKPRTEVRFLLLLPIKFMYVILNEFNTRKVGGLIINYKKRDNESFSEWAERLILNKDIYELEKDEIYEILYGKTLAYDNARKRLYGIIEHINKVKEEEINDKKSKNITIPKSHMKRLKDIIGEYDIKKRLMQQNKNQIMKVKRDLIPVIALTEDLWDRMEENNFTVKIPDYCYEPINESISNNNDKYKMIINISDWHIGYIINDCKGNNFNWGIANQRVEKLLQNVIKYVKLYNIKHIYVVNNGDTIEHTYMRKNQSQFCEFGRDEQINKSIELIYKMLVGLARYSFVEFYSLAGNHDRANGDVKESLKGDNANVIITRQLYKYNTLTHNKRILVHDGCPFVEEVFLEVNGTLHKFIHGDNKKAINGKKLLQQEMSMDDKNYHLWRGHYHNFNISSENNGRYIISTGCLSGFNDYSSAFGSATRASQTIGIIGDGEIELIKDVQL